MLGTRLLVTAVAAPVVLALAYLGGWPLFCLILAAAILGLVELRSLFAGMKLTTFWPVAFLAVALFVLEPWYPGLALAATVLTVLGGLLWALAQPIEPARGAMSWAIAVAAPAYLGVPLGLALALRGHDGPGTALVSLGPLSFPSGFAWLGLALLLTWACDGAAYLAGRSLGRRPFFARISPRKTLEGTAAGIVAAAVVGLTLGSSVGLPPAAGAILGAVAGAAAVFGDLAESLLKRAAGAKDSGRLFPGHGGLLDRVDSLLFVFVVVYYGRELARLASGLADVFPVG